MQLSITAGGSGPRPAQLRPRWLVSRYVQQNRRGYYLLCLAIIVLATSGSYERTITPGRDDGLAPVPLMSSSTSRNQSVVATLTAVADTYDNSVSPGSVVGGSSGALYVDTNPIKRAFVRFDLRSLRGTTIQSVNLKLATTPDTYAGSVKEQHVKLTKTNTWSESLVSYTNSVPIEASTVGTIPTNSLPNTQYSVALNSSVFQRATGSLISMAVESAGDDEFVFFSRETTRKPQLVVTYLPRLFGVLIGQNKYLGTDWNAGIRVREVELNWGAYQPKDNTWDTAYVTMKRAEFQKARDAGYQLVLDLGIQYPPQWARAIRPWRDQYGNTYDKHVNAIWSPLVRRKIEIYVQRLFQDFGTDFLGVRLGSGGWVETMYPDSVSGYQFNYWAFDADAMTTNPVPKWRPGQASPNGEARTFYNWYLQRLIGTVNWQQDVVRRSYNGYLLQLFTGLGVRPAGYETLIKYNLKPTGQIGVDAAARGVVIDRIIKGMKNKSKVIIYATGLADSTATAPWVDEASPDPMKWSAAHWIAYNADSFGLPKWAENAGHNNDATMRLEFKQMHQFGYSALLWAWNEELYDGIHAPLSLYADLIRQYK